MYVYTIEDFGSSHFTARSELQLRFPFNLAAPSVAPSIAKLINLSFSLNVFPNCQGNTDIQERRPC